MRLRALHGLVIGLLATTAGSFSSWFLFRHDSAWAAQWLPNLGTETLAIGVTVLVVDRVIRGELERAEASRLLPIRRSAFAFLRHAIDGLVRDVASIAYQGDDAEDARPDDVVTLFRDWTNHIEYDLTAEDTTWVWDVQLKHFVGELETFRNRYGEIVSEELVARIDEYLLFSKRPGFPVWPLVAIRRRDPEAAREGPPAWKLAVDRLRANTMPLADIVEAFEADSGLALGAAAAFAAADEEARMTEEFERESCEAPALKRLGWWLRRRRNEVLRRRR